MVIYDLWSYVIFGFIYCIKIFGYEVLELVFFKKKNFLIFMMAIYVKKMCERVYNKL